MSDSYLTGHHRNQYRPFLPQKILLESADLEMHFPLDFYYGQSPRVTLGSPNRPNLATCPKQQMEKVMIKSIKVIYSVYPYWEDKGELKSSIQSWEVSEISIMFK